MLILKNINKSYHKKVIANFSYIFKKGTIYSIIGSSGCGKSTLLSIIVNKIKKYHGQVIYNNNDVKKLKNYVFNDVGFVNQSYQLFDDLTAYENVCLHFKLINKNVQEYHYKIKQLFKYFNVLQTLHTKVKNLSGGQKQRVAIIKAIIKNPSIILLDEPTSALDNQCSLLLLNYLQRIKHDKIIIIVTHDNNLAKMCDETINLNNYQKAIIGKVTYHFKKEKKIKFYETKWIHKKVFSTKKVFNYICSSILSLGLISISLSLILSSFIKDVVNKTFNNIAINNAITFKVQSDDTIIDFSKPISNFDTIYYEGLETNFKNKVKKNSIIDSVNFNDYNIENSNFVFDNYLSNHSKNFVLYIPLTAKQYIQQDNYLNIYFQNEEFKIKIDAIYLSNDNNFYIYCNNVSYLQHYFKNLNIDYELSSFLYSIDTWQLFDYLTNEISYQNYLFILDSSNSIIQIFDSYYPRINIKTLNRFLKENDDPEYIISDYINTYIDYESGFIYLLIEYDSFLVKIDNTLPNNTINITSKLKNKNLTDLTINNVKLSLNNIINDNIYEIIYMNTTTFNNLNNNIVYSGMIFNNNNIKKVDNIIVNDSLFTIDSFDVFNHISEFLLFFAIMILLLSLVSFFIVFTINFISKKKDILLLFDLGLYKEKIIAILLYDPINNIISAIASNIIASIFSIFFISFIYQLINKTTIELSISISFHIFMIFLPFLIILPLIIIKIGLLFKKNMQK